MADEQMGFGWDAEPPPAAQRPERAERLAARMSALAARRIYLGMSSWKYPGWLGQVYDAQRYQVRGRFSQKKFDRDCLAEYAAVFPTVCGDFAFYQFPSSAQWQRIFEQVPAGFQFSLKVPEDITVERFPDLPRYGDRAGQINPGFMDPGLVRTGLLLPLEAYRDRVGVIIFEFGTIHDGPLREPRTFAARLDAMLAQLPLERFRFAVEVRNPDFLDPAGGYAEVLAARRVAHCFNSWTRMPPVEAQLRIPGLLTADHVAARFLLRPGRTYQQAVNQFAPYDKTVDPFPEGRAALRELIQRCLAEDRALFAFVNNRFEGSAVETLESLDTDAVP